jgi:hypothetical protein
MIETETNMLTLLAAIFLSTPAPSQPGLAQADALFTQGKFDAALTAYAQAPDGGAKALRRQGQIHLFANRWDDAETLLQKALALDPADKAAAAAMGEVESRRGRFDRAAQWFAKAGRADAAAAHALFGAARPFDHTLKPGARAEIPFVQTDPLPAVAASVNGREGLFILDTGAGPIVLDPDFAAAAKIEVAGTGAQGVFAGGKTADVKSGKIGTLSLNGFNVANVPAILVSTAAFSGVTGGKPVAGVIGTGLFSRFRTTIDYRRGALILERRETTPPGGALARIPVFQIGTHYLLAEGQLNGAEPSLFFIDTGLAGFAFTAPASSLSAARIALPALSADKGGIGQSAAGEFRIASLKLGPHIRDNLKGLYGPFPPQLENGLGVRIGGLVSHQFFRPYTLTLDFASMSLELR